MITSPFCPPKITPPPEHPRVMLRRKDFGRVRANMQLPECQREYALWQQLCDRDFREFDEVIEKGVYHSLVCIILEAKAFRALLNNDESLSRELIEMALRLSGCYDPESDWLMKARFGGHVVHTCAICYDWLYPYFTPEQRLQLIDNCEKILSTTLEMGYPPSKQSTIGSHAAEAQLLRDSLSFAIAVYDERPDIYNFCAGRIFDEYVPTYKIFHGSRYPMQGPTYGGYRYCFSAWCQLLFEAMSGEKVFDENLENLCESLLYLIRPTGEYMRIGDDFNESKGKTSYTNRKPATVPMFLAGALTGRDVYRDYYFRNYDELFLVPDKYGRDYYSNGSFSEGMLSPTVFLVFNRFTEPVESPVMPKARYFGTPAGVTLYKDGETLLIMKIGERFTTAHEHYDCGHFEIYHKGILASDSGYYDWFGCEHHYNYLARTYAHNCVTVSDPEKIGTNISFWNKPDAIYDGGQLLIRGGYDVPDLESLERDYRRGVVLSHTETENLVEISGDLTVPYQESCDHYVRTMRFEPKAGQCGVFTVRDEITAKSENFIKQFHVHCQTEPVIEADNRFVIENGGGRLVCTVLEPKNCTIAKTGGKDNEYSLYGVNHPRHLESLHGGENANGNSLDEGGWGRITVTAGDKKKTDTFVVRFEIFDLA
ncbi:MAG: heparinase II/III family protein [Clostridia bacterium]|nr:heparinase II/III family protein [Clostridia bacterium]